MRCGACGASITYQSARKRGLKYGYLVCQTAQKRGAAACPGSRVPLRELEGFVVEKIKGLGQDTRLVAETLRAAKHGLEARRPQVQAHIRRLKEEVETLGAERGNLLDAIAATKTRSPAILRRLGELEVAIEDAECKIGRVEAELSALETQVIDEEDLRAAMAAFTPLWDALFPAELARILRLLLEKVTYNAAAGEVSLTFRPSGVKVLASECEGVRA